MSSNASSSSSVPRTSPTALRPLRTELGSLARADGSATFCFGPLEVISSVLGPTEVRIRDELTDSATLDITFQPLSGVAGIPSKAVSDSLHTLLSSVLLLHHHPRSMIQIVLQTLSSPLPPRITSRRGRRRHPVVLGPDASPSPTEKACLINAASLALLDAGIVARGTVTACACAVLREDEGSVLRQAGGSVLSDAQVQDRVRDWRTERGLPVRDPTGTDNGASQEDKDDDDDKDMDEETDTIVLLDPTPTELNYALSTHVFAFSFSGQQVSASASEGQSTKGLVSDQVFAESLGAVSLEDHRRAAELCREACKSILGFMRGAMTKRVETQVVSVDGS